MQNHTQETPCSAPEWGDLGGVDPGQDPGGYPGAAGGARDRVAGPGQVGLAPGSGCPARLPQRLGQTAAAGVDERHHHAASGSGAGCGPRRSGPYCQSCTCMARRTATSSWPCGGSWAIALPSRPARSRGCRPSGNWTRRAGASGGRGERGALCLGRRAVLQGGPQGGEGRAAGSDRRLRRRASGAVGGAQDHLAGGGRATLLEPQGAERAGPGAPKGAGRGPGASDGHRLCTDVRRGGAPEGHPREGRRLIRIYTLIDKTSSPVGGVHVGK